AEQLGKPLAVFLESRPVAIALPDLVLLAQQPQEDRPFAEKGKPGQVVFHPGGSCLRLQSGYSPGPSSSRPILARCGLTPPKSPDTPAVLPAGGTPRSAPAGRPPRPRRNADRRLHQPGGIGCVLRPWPATLRAGVRDAPARA